MEYNLYDMKLHENKAIGEEVNILRVPGGWIYRIWENTGNIENGYNISQCFVPYNDEFNPNAHTLTK